EGAPSRSRRCAEKRGSCRGSAAVVVAMAAVREEEGLGSGVAPAFRPPRLASPAKGVFPRPSGRVTLTLIVSASVALPLSYERDFGVHSTGFEPASSSVSSLTASRWLPSKRTS